tara:strand:+ start:335 stop:760 length:426 start_codon:yes stop_codon:yes gene_type:complete
MEPCGGCRYEEYPYKAQLPIFKDGKRPLWEFKSDKDIWKAVDLLIEELHENNKKGKEFDIEQSVQAQLPFFCCINRIFDKNIQKDIQRYMYCEKFGISPYEGDYGKQPCLWVEKSFIIKKAFARLESNQINKAKENGTRNN